MQNAVVGVIDIYIAVWWLNEIAQPLAIIFGVLVWTWDRRR